MLDQVDIIQSMMNGHSYVALCIHLCLWAVYMHLFSLSSILHPVARAIALFSPLFRRHTCSLSHYSAPGSFAAFIQSAPAVTQIVFIHIFIPLIIIICWYQTEILYFGTSRVSWRYRGSLLPLILTKSRWLWLGWLTDWAPFVCGCSVAA